MADRCLACTKESKRKGRLCYYVRRFRKSIQTRGHPILLVKLVPTRIAERVFESFPYYVVPLQLGNVKEEINKSSGIAVENHGEPEPG